TEGNSVRPLRNGDEIFTAMLDAIGSARHTIDSLCGIPVRRSPRQREGRHGNCEAGVTVTTLVSPELGVRRR
ncbi:hypothetical protein ACWCP7_19305, partial [Streptomyces goshikiensis]